jgi:hypothetical protein
MFSESHNPLGFAKTHLLQLLVMVEN